MNAEPCFRCPLADCDDRSPACIGRKAWRMAASLRRRGKPVPAEISADARWFYNEIYYPAWRAGRSETGGAEVRP